MALILLIFIAYDLPDLVHTYRSVLLRLLIADSRINHGVHAIAHSLLLSITIHHRSISWLLLPPIDTNTVVGHGARRVQAHHSFGSGAASESPSS